MDTAFLLWNCDAICKIPIFVTALRKNKIIIGFSQNTKLKGMLHLGITEKERRCRKTRHLRSKFYIFSFLIISFLRLKFYEFLLFYALFLSSLAPSDVFIYACRLQSAISALNQASPKSCFALRIQHLQLF